MLDRTNQIVVGDCLAILAALPENGIDLTVFSPPYDSLRDYRKGAWTFDSAALADQLLRVTRPGGICAVVIGDSTRHFAKSLTSFRLAIDWCDRAGWRLFECCIYHRDGNPGAWWGQRFRVDHEYILIFLKGERPRQFDKTPLMVPAKHTGRIFSGTDRLTSGGLKPILPKIVAPMKCRGTVWKYATSNTEGNRLKLLHPASFPDKLAEDLILCFSRPGDLVLDPMCGSGTTCVMAARNQRRYLGIEINPAYARVTHQRLASEVSPPPA